MYSTRYVALSALFLLGIFGFSLLIVHFLPLDYLKRYIGTEHYVTSAAVYIALTFISTVIAPIGVLPITPSVGIILGPLQTALMSAFGWITGAIAAFLLARYIGRPALSRVIPFARIDAYERLIPIETEFWITIALRVVMPVDVLSYALGFFSRIPFGIYVLATAIGVLPFSFVFAYLGVAVQTGSQLITTGLILASFALFSISFYFAFHYWRWRERRGERGRTADMEESPR